MSDESAMHRAAAQPEPAPVAGVVEDAEFLCARLREFERDLLDDDAGREYNGHVSPALARLEDALSSLQPAQQAPADQAGLRYNPDNPPPGGSIAARPTTPASQPDAETVERVAKAMRKAMTAVDAGGEGSEFVAFIDIEAGARAAIAALSSRGMKGE